MARIATAVLLAAMAAAAPEAEVGKILDAFDSARPPAARTVLALTFDEGRARLQARLPADLLRRFAELGQAAAGPPPTAAPPPEGK
jgi:hypothetical protein